MIQAGSGCPRQDLQRLLSSVRLRKYREATVHRAYVMIRELEWPLDKAGRLDRARILEAMPEDCVREARARVRKRRGWTGKGWKELLNDSGFHTYGVYAYMSELSHGSAELRNVVWESSETGGRQLRLGLPFAAGGVRLRCEHGPEVSSLRFQGVLGCI